MSTLSFSPCRLPLTLSQDGPSLPLQGLVPSPLSPGVATGIMFSGNTPQGVEAGPWKLIPMSLLLES